MVKSFRPGTLSEALSILSSEKAIPFAGGTDLMVRHRASSGVPPRFSYPLLFLGSIKELCKTYSTEKEIVLGAGITLADLLESDKVPPPLKAAAVLMAGPGIRNVATLGGNICNASPAGDSLPFLYAVSAEVELAGLKGNRRVPIQEFITGPGKTVLQEDELLLSVCIPRQDIEGYSYRKIGTRRADSLSKLSFLGLRLSGGQGIRMALGAAAPRVVRSADAEKELLPLFGAEPERIRPEAVRLYGPLLSPIDDQRSTAKYRSETAFRLITSFLSRGAV